MILYIMVFLFKNRRKINRKDFAYLIFFAIPPSVGGILQVILSVPGVSIIWIATTLSVYIIFINIQKEQLHTDYLTGVNNRRCLDSFLKTITKNRTHEFIAGIMIDIDSFKMINDMYGHEQGDRALKYTSQILIDTFRKTDFIARYGGDEFVVVMQMDEHLELARMVQRLKENIAQFNLKNIAPYELKLSMGYDYYTNESGVSISEFMRKIDSLLYLDKKKTRNEG